MDVHVFAIPRREPLIVKEYALFARPAGIPLQAQWLPLQIGHIYLALLVVLAPLLQQFAQTVHSPAHSFYSAGLVDREVLAKSLCLLALGCCAGETLRNRRP